MQFSPMLMLLLALAAFAETDVLPGTQPLKLEDDAASLMVDGIDRFLLREIEKAKSHREELWRKDGIEEKRKRLAKILGLLDTRIEFSEPELVATPAHNGCVGHGEGFDVFAIRWPVLSDPQPNRKLVSMHGEGLMLVPKAQPLGELIVLPNSDQTPEQLAGLAPGIAAPEQAARMFARAGYRVVVPVLIDRAESTEGLTRRELLYRCAFELGRHLIGYELQKVFALVDWLSKTKRPIGVAGEGDGGMLALYAAAFDTRIERVCISGYFGPRERIWEEPLDRNVFGRLNEFGDAELAGMIAPRHTVVLNSPIPEREWRGKLGAPFKLKSVSDESVKSEALRSVEEHGKASSSLLALKAGESAFLKLARPAEKGWDQVTPGADFKDSREKFDPAARQMEQFYEIDRHNQALLRESGSIRANFVKPLVDAAAKSPAEFEKVSAEFRRKFYDEIIGRFDLPLKPTNARSHKLAESDKWTRYEVMLDVFDDVFAYGYLTIPKDIKENEKRSVVVCQHGLEGRPKDVVEGDHKAYHDFATKLAERGYITFAPQNPYIFTDRFRTLQRKANSIGKTLFSVIVPQHQQIVNWLKTLPQVRADKIGFYGLSYGGKTAMRVPAIVTDYCLSICSADFNEWVWKNAATDTFGLKYSYANKQEYEIFEWNLGSTFNYAEMAMLIAPRPFMVERGHHDGVAPDETVAWEFSKVKRFYDVNLKLPGRAKIEWFNGPHTINGVGTFEFLDQWLK